MYIEKAITILTVNKIISREQEDFVEATEIAIQALAKQKPIKLLGHTPFGSCPNCKYEFNSELINEYNIVHCPWCGQRFKEDKK